MKNQPIFVTAEVDTFEKAKELLADLEVLNEKYVVSAQISIYQDQIMSYGLEKESEIMQKHAEMRASNYLQ